MPPKFFSLIYYNSPGPSECKGPWPVPHYDSEGRLSSLEWHGNGDAASRRVAYEYDADGRISAVANDLFSVAYDYHAGGYEQGYSLALPSGATLVRHVVRNAYRTHPIEAVQNFFVTASGVTNALPSFAYALDGLMRPVQRNADEFAYDVRSQLTSATLRSADTNAFAYVYDTAGNRTTASDSGASVAFAANQLNQYESVAETIPAYDIDGNLLTNGVWSYAWDAANRLAAACSNGVCVVSNAYDALSRRVLKVTPTETRTFLYDGWNMVREEVRDNATSFVTETRDYYWGRDLSGSLQGAGGVGGLLAYARNGALRIPVYDHIGNVVAVVDDSGSIVAAYEYDPFGNIVAQSGPEADEVPFRFSTKYFDPETGLYYYGYRFYEPELGCWINRDPLGVLGGVNEYLSCGNAFATNYDYLGLLLDWGGTADEAIDQLNQLIAHWRDQGWNFAADALGHFLENTPKNKDLSGYAGRIYSNEEWRTAFLEHIWAELLKLGKINGQETHVGLSDAESTKLFSSDLSEPSSFAGLKPLFEYRFYPIVDQELFYALAGSRYTYHGTAKGCYKSGARQLALNLSVLSWDMLAFPASHMKYRNMAQDYRAANYLETRAGYRQKNYIYLKWNESGVWQQYYGITAIEKDDSESWKWRKVE